LVVAEAHGPIDDDGLGMDQQIVESEAIDEWLQGGARRADGLHQIVLTEPPIVEIVAGADVGAYLAAAVLHDKHGDRRSLLQLQLIAPRQSLELRLQPAVDKRANER